jgi:hypothetical protein
MAAADQKFQPRPRQYRRLTSRYVRKELCNIRI